MAAKEAAARDLVPAQAVPRAEEVRTEILARLTASGTAGDQNLARRLQADKVGAALLRRAVLVLLNAQAQFTMYSEHRLHRAPPDAFDREFLHEMVLMAVVGMLRGETDMRRAPAKKGGEGKEGFTKYGDDVRDRACDLYRTRTQHMKWKSERYAAVRRLLAEEDKEAGISRPLPPPGTIRDWVEDKKSAYRRK